MNSDPDYFAILIGINAYPSKPLKGCVNDVIEIEKHLKTMQFSVQTQVLIAEKSAVEIENLSTDHEYQWPTYENVRSVFQRTTTSAKKGDFIYVHFAGHGTRARTSDVFANNSTGDLALVLLDDGAGCQEQYLRGAELASWLNEMVKRGLVVTLVLDCCFAASVYRYDDLDIRYLPETSRAEWLSSANSLEKARLRGASAMKRDASMRPNWLINPDAYAILVASGPDQEAKELQTSDGRYHGVLSFLLLRTWHRCGSTRTKHKIIYHHLCVETRKYRIRQHPILYGNKDQGFFGKQSFEIESVPIMVSKDQDGKWLILAGEAHGICVGDELTISQISTARSTSEPIFTPVVAKVSQVRVLTSYIETEDMIAIRNNTVLAAELRVRASYSLTRVIVSHDIPIRDELMEALQTRHLNPTTDVNDPEARFMISVDRNMHYNLCHRSAESVTNLSKLIPQPIDASVVCDAIEHLITYENLRQLNCRSFSSLCRCTDIGINHNESHSKSGECIRVNNGTICELVVKNQTGRDLFVFVYGLGPDWQVENLLRGTYEVVPPAGFERGLTGDLRKRLRMSIAPEKIKQGIRDCTDTIKVICTSQPAVFDLFDLPKLGQPRERKKTRQMRYAVEDGNHTSDEQARVCTFPIQTIEPE